MKYRYLGQSGMRVSVVGLGTNSFGKRADKETSIRIIHQAIESGINFIDTANTYAGGESERIIGEGIAHKRQEIVLATKAGLVTGQGPNDRGSSRYHITRELERSLQRLHTDYVDLYQIHTFDPYTPLEETLRALDDFVTAGKIRYIGASNYAAWELMKALGLSRQLGLTRFVSIQPSYSLADRTPETELVPLCLDQGVGLIPYYPLAGGILTGKYHAGLVPPIGSRAETDASFAKRLDAGKIQLSAHVSELAKARGVSAAALSLAWLIAKPVVSTMIVGATKVDQLLANLGAIDVAMDAQTLQSLEQISDSFRYYPPFGFYRLAEPTI